MLCELDFRKRIGLLFKLTLLTVLFSSWLPLNAIAKDDMTFDLLAGVEAGIDTVTAMSENDLTQTQYVLNYHPVGVGYTWYNKNTDTLYRLEVKKRYLQPKSYYCSVYNLEIVHHKQSMNKDLRACQNNQGNWISLFKEAHVEEMIPKKERLQ